MRRVTCIAAALWGLLALPAPAAALPPDQAVAALNAQRAAHGIPAGIAHNPEWSSWCALHNEYQRLNGGVLVHDEFHGDPGYSDQGAMAARSSVLSRGRSWDTGNPWELAPIHLHQLLAPRLDSMGVDDSGGYTCATTLLARNRPAPPADVVYTYPGAGTVHRFEETAFESPYTPGELVGIPAGTLTGPYLYVSIDGPDLEPGSDARIEAASLVGPDGPVELRMVDNYTSGLEGYLPPGGELIPLRPLRGRASYTASVALVAGAPPGRRFTHSWTFSTPARDPGASFTAWPTRDGVSLWFDSLSSGPNEVVAARAATSERVTAAIPRAQRTALRLPPGTWSVCVSQPDHGEYGAYAACAQTLARIAAPPPRIRLGKPRRAGRRVRLSVSSDEQLAGRRLTVKSVLRTRTGRRISSRTRSVRGGRKATVALRRPRRGQSLRVTVRSRRFARVDYEVPAASARLRIAR